MNKERLFQYMEEKNIDFLILDSLENVSYTSGMGVPVPYGALFAYGGGMPLAYSVVSVKDRKVTLICSSAFENYTKYAKADKVFLFENYNHFRKADGEAGLKAILKKLLPENGKGYTAGIEKRSCPVIIGELLTGFHVIDAEETLKFARKIKTPEEIIKIRKSAEIEDCGQNRLLEYARNYHGETDFEMWSGITQAMNEAAGKVARISGELALGLNAEIRDGLGGPSGIRGTAGDMCRMDISIRYHGYWCDCTNTVVMGRKPDERQTYYFQVVEEAYEAVKECLIPGKKLSDAAEAEAKVYKKYGMEPQVYTGHQIGCGVNEPGRIVCYEHDILEPQMVVCIEPQQYGDPGEGIGVRLERVIEITEKGPQELNKFSWGHKIW